MRDHNHSHCALVALGCETLVPRDGFCEHCQHIISKQVLFDVQIGDCCVDFHGIRDVRGTCSITTHLVLQTTQGLAGSTFASNGIAADVEFGTGFVLLDTIRDVVGPLVT